MSAIMNELLKVAKMKAPKTIDQPFLLKLRKAADAKFDENEDAWEALSAEAQNWMNDAAKAVKKEKPLPMFADAEPAEEDDDENENSTDAADDAAETEEDEEMSKTAKKAPKKAPAKKAAPKKAAAENTAKKAVKAPAKKAAPKKANGGKVKSLARAARELICSKPELDTAAIVKKLEAQGYEASISTIGTLRSDGRAMIKVLQDLGINPAKINLDA